jgi:phosphinothricin acetyltransferase
MSGASTVQGEVTVRLARAADSEPVSEIYNQGIAERSATFETDPRTPSDLARRIEEDPQRFPVLVAEQAGSIVGWTSIGPYRDRRCYAGVGELSVYVHRDARGRGVGRLLVAQPASRSAALSASARSAGTKSTHASTAVGSTWSSSSG